LAYRLDEQYNAKNFTAQDQVALVPGWGGLPREILFITIHHWGDPSWGQTYEGVVDWFCNPNSSVTTSAHYVVSAGEVACIVSPWDAAWHAGGWGLRDFNKGLHGNRVSIGIECNPLERDDDYVTVAELVRNLRAQFGNIPLVHHCDWTATDCPGTYDLGKIDALAKGMFAGMSVPQSPNPPQPTNKGTGYEPDPHWEVDPGDTLGKIAEYYGLDVDHLAAYNGIKDPNQISVGEWIWPCNGRDTWVVDPGDTLGKIAAYYGISVDAICNTNGINNPDVIKVGQRLNIPN
jgi:N-acetylmuramoyl-L-alanine amidase